MFASGSVVLSYLMVVARGMFMEWVPDTTGESEGTDCGWHVGLAGRPDLWGDGEPGTVSCRV